MKITALLPMKGHSERVPNKNTRLFCGCPLYHSIIEALLKSEFISKIVINTDSDAIKEDALTFFEDRVAIHDRPSSIQGDFVSMNKIIGYDIEKLQENHFLQTHSTNPLLKTETIDRAIEQYFSALKEECDSLFSITVWRKRLYDEDSRPVNHDPEELIRTQDLPPLYEENSCLYLFNRASFKWKNRRIGRKPFMFEIPFDEAFDIDEEMDFRIAELLYKYLKE